MPWRCVMYSSRPHALFCGESEGRQARMKCLRALWVVVRLALISMIAAELFLRFFKPVEFRAPEPELPAAERAQMLFRRSSVPGLPYEMAPNMEKIADGAWVRTNGYGMRDREPLPDDTPSLFRIVAIGDSFAFGLGVPVEAAFPRGSGETAERFRHQRHALRSAEPGGSRILHVGRSPGAEIQRAEVAPEAGGARLLS